MVTVRFQCVEKISRSCDSGGGCDGRVHGTGDGAVMVWLTH